MARVIVVGVDGSEAGSRAAHFAAQHAREAGDQLVVAYVVPWSPYTVQSAEENERRRITGLVRHGHRAAEGIAGGFSACSSPASSGRRSRTTPGSARPPSRTPRCRPTGR